MTIKEHRSLAKVEETRLIDSFRMTVDSASVADIWDDDTWPQKEEDKVLESWANRTFTSTCYKLTLQNNPDVRQKAGPLYSFLENWQLHSMYNKSQKVLLGLTNRRPCVILTGDDFMFTIPPNAEIANSSASSNADTNAVTLESLCHQQQQQQSNVVQGNGTGIDGTGDNNDNTNNIDSSQGGQSFVQQDDGDTKLLTNEGLWMHYGSTSVLRVANGISDFDLDDDDDDDDVYDDEDDMDNDNQSAMIIGHDDNFSGVHDIPFTTDFVSPTLRRSHMIGYTSQAQSYSTQRNDYDAAGNGNGDDFGPDLDTDCNKTLVTTASERRNSGAFEKYEDTVKSTSKSKDNSQPPAKLLSWRQRIKAMILFTSQRIVEAAYLIAELAESMATSKDNLSVIAYNDSCHFRLLDYHRTVTLRLGRYVVAVFRVWRVCFLGVEMIMHGLFSLDTNSSTCLFLFPLLKVA